MNPPKNFETVRLFLRPPVFEDAEFIFNAYAQDIDVTRYMIWPRHESINDTKEFLRRCERVWKEGSAFPWIIERKSDGQLMGMIEIGIEDFRAHLGYVLAKSYWGQGYMPEAGCALRDWFLSQPEIYRFEAFCDAENQASIRVMEKLGMHREGCIRRWAVMPNISADPRDCYFYSIVQ